MGTALVIALIFLALVAVIFSAANSLARTHAPLRAAPAEAGLAARLICPRTRQPAAVRLGLDPIDRALQVIWCEHFPKGKIDCGRPCFTTLPSRSGARLVFEHPSLS
ncbi:MAG: hypothetical protein KatS3mg081_1550 [Gemmatimonadales bacterium]|nr:hypothetical protein HRbin33_00766 [bacterium HR33]GIW52195.1 MAG: hypothetical protein KatS3mg081_1550 [Gemmatimonadales bacterium]